MFCIILYHKLWYKEHVGIFSLEIPRRRGACIHYIYILCYYLGFMMIHGVALYAMKWWYCPLNWLNIGWKRGDSVRFSATNFHLGDLDRHKLAVIIIHLYPLVNVYSLRTGKSPSLIGKSTINVPCSIAMLVITRGYMLNFGMAASGSYWNDSYISYSFPAGRLAGILFVFYLAICMGH